MMKNMSKTNKIIVIVIGLLILAWGITYNNWWGLIGIIPVALAFVPVSKEPEKEKPSAPKVPEVPGMGIKEEPKEEMPMAEAPKMAEEESTEEPKEEMPKIDMAEQEKEHMHS